MLYIDGDLIRSRLFVLPTQTPRNVKKGPRGRKSKFDAGDDDGD